jgi:hypothetical protein
VTLLDAICGRLGCGHKLLFHDIRGCDATETCDCPEFVDAPLVPLDGEPEQLELTMPRRKR